MFDVIRWTIVGKFLESLIERSAVVKAYLIGDSGLGQTVRRIINQEIFSFLYAVSIHEIKEGRIKNARSRFGMYGFVKDSLVLTNHLTEDYD